MRPLLGVHVLDLTRLLPGAYATLLLADLGADVVKVEDPRGGDGMRTLPLAHGRNIYFDALNRHKRSITLDLRSPDAAAVLDALAARADVVAVSYTNIPAHETKANRCCPRG
jgi:alpha-methylacyl-CoA racemase